MSWCCGCRRSNSSSCSTNSKVRQHPQRHQGSNSRSSCSTNNKVQQHQDPQRNPQAGMRAASAARGRCRKSRRSSSKSLSCRRCLAKCSTSPPCWSGFRSGCKGTNSKMRQHQQMQHQQLHRNPRAAAACRGLRRSALAAAAGAARWRSTTAAAAGMLASTAGMRCAARGWAAAASSGRSGERGRSKTSTTMNILSEPQPP